MKIKLTKLLLAVISLLVYNQYGITNSLSFKCKRQTPSDNDSCLLQEDNTLQDNNTQELPIIIKSTKAQSSYPDYFIFNGNVNINQGNRTLKSDEVQLHQKKTLNTSITRIIDAFGHVEYSDPQIILKGSKAWLNLDSKDTDVWHGKYQIVNRQGHGEADKIKIRDNNRYTIIKNGTFTSCPLDEESWSIAGSKIIHDHTKQMIKIWNCYFKISSLPVLYTPYIQIPIGDKRRSGFLIPNTKYSHKNGFEFMLPYYWNITSQMDATFTPYYMSHRGIQWRNELRYLKNLGIGLIAFDYLNKDQIYKKNKHFQHNHDINRWLFHWQHSGIYHHYWKFNIDHTKISDKNYFIDLNSLHGSITNSYMNQKLSFGYVDNNWEVMLSSKKFQNLSSHDNNQMYSSRPQLDINFYQNNFGRRLFDFYFYGQAVKFININNNYPRTMRVHLEPTIILPFSNHWFHINTQAKFFTTYYKQENITFYNTKSYINNNKLKKYINRNVIQLKTDAQTLLFNRNINKLSYTQTLEPHIQFLYTSYSDQSHIYSYDSTLLHNDYIGLFRDKIYSGLDRIASTNKITTGITTKIFDKELIERFNLSIGQIYSITPSKTGLNSLDNEYSGSLAWAGNSYWKINQHWIAYGNFQYDIKLNHIAQGNAVLQYHRDIERILQFNYNYNSKEYVYQKFFDYHNNLRWHQKISQIGATVSWPITVNWSIVGAFYYDNKTKKPFDRLLGVQYNSCCYAIRLSYERKINGWENKSSKYDDKILFSIELRGLNTRYKPDISNILNHSIIPYQRIA